MSNNCVAPFPCRFRETPNRSNLVANHRKDEPESEHPVGDLAHRSGRQCTQKSIRTVDSKARANWRLTKKNKCIHRQRATSPKIVRRKSWMRRERALRIKFGDFSISIYFLFTACARLLSNMLWEHIRAMIMITNVRPNRSLSPASCINSCLFSVCFFLPPIPDQITHLGLKARDDAPPRSERQLYIKSTTAHGRWRLVRRQKAANMTRINVFEMLRVALLLICLIYITRTHAEETIESTNSDDRSLLADGVGKKCIGSSHCTCSF